MAVPSGLTVVRDMEGPGGMAGQHYARFVGYGTYTAADFSITAVPTYEDPTGTGYDPNADPASSTAVQLTYGGLGFTPKRVRVLNLTDRTETDAYVNANLGTANAEGLKTVAAGTRTYAAHGVTVDGRKITIDVSVAGPITDNDDFVIECWG